MNSVILPTSKASIASSSRATWTDAIRGTFVPSDDRVIASSAPTVKRSSWIFDSRSGRRLRKEIRLQDVGENLQAGNEPRSGAVEVARAVDDPHPACM